MGTVVVIMTVFVYHVRVILKVIFNTITIVVVVIIIIIIGGNCQRCKHGFYGNPVNGRNCSGKNHLFKLNYNLSLIVCDCNGYNRVCDTNNGTCDCLDAGVSGDHCTICNTLSAYQGNASNFCYCELI